MTTARPSPRAFALIFLLAVLSGCDTGDGDLASAAQSVGLADAPAAAPEVFDVACDLSIKTPCTPARVRDLLGRLLPFAADRPGSVIRLWAIGQDVGNVQVLAEAASPPMPTRRKQIASARRTWVADSERFFLKALEPFASAPPARRSPIFEAVTKIGLTIVPNISRRRLYLITDGLEYSGFASFEAAEIPPAEALGETLRRERVLTPGTLKGTQVHFVYTDVSRRPSGRGRTSVARMVAITDTWDYLLRQASASDVSFSSGLPPFDDTAPQGGPK